MERLCMETLEIDLKDPRIFEAVFDMFFHRAHSFALKILKDEMISADIVQEAFLYMWEKANYFSSMLSFKCYLYNCVKNKCLNYMRDYQVERKMRELEDVYFDETNIEHWIIEQELRARILEEINKLQGVKRDIMLLRLEGNSYDEISEELQLNINTVKNHKKQAYKELKIRLSDCEKYVFLIVLLLISIL